MRGLRKPCPRCGREKEIFIGKVCSDCYAEVYEIAELPREIEMMYCPSCGSYRLQGEWIGGAGGAEETIKEYAFLRLSQKIRPSSYIEEAFVKGVEVRELHKDEGALLIRIEGRSGEAKVEQMRSIRLKLVKRLCPSCMKRAAGSHSAVVQVRPIVGRLSDREKREIISVIGALDERARGSIVKIEETKEGMDIMIDDPSIARLIAAKVRSTFGGQTEESFKLKSWRGGEKRGVLSISTRILNLSVGDAVAKGGEAYLFAGLSGARAVLLNVESGDIVSESADGLREYRRLERPAGLRRVTYAGESEGSLVFYDEEGRVIEAPKEKVRVVSGSLSRGGSYVAYFLREVLFVMGDARGGRKRS